MIIKVTFLLIIPKVYATLSKAGINPSEVDGLDNCFLESSSHPFSGLETQYLQMQYFRTELKLIVRIRGLTFVLHCCMKLNGRNLFLLYLVSIEYGKVEAESEDVSLSRINFIIFQYYKPFKLFSTIKSFFQR